MNHPKGEESTNLGQSCSLTYHLSSKALFCGRASPEPLRPGRTFPKGRDLCGGSRPLFFRQGETWAAGFVRWSERDPSDRADGDDQLLCVAGLPRVDDKGQKPVAGFARERTQRQPLTIP